ncbi:hypothetical protein CEXT_700551 [Caerostris extrusa]|uniref:Uncharacterized protein n=1 Tax=Caerostris extrusa TaxID=172846 RepID=A0AAV4UIU0_CAEEX|nr:hypothetical protein CEXT_700551 [Caerostris extrusa]
MKVGNDAHSLNDSFRSNAIVSHSQRCCSFLQAHPFMKYALRTQFQKDFGLAEGEGDFCRPSLAHLDDRKINLREVLKDHGWLLKANATILTQLGIKGKFAHHVNDCLLYSSF